MKKKLSGMRKTALSLLLALALFASASLPAFADEADVAKGETSMEITPEYAEEVRQMRGDGILDTEELDRLAEEFITEHKLNKDRISFGYCYLETGDEYFYNGDTWYYPGSVYKVPLMMLVAEKVSAGELEQDGDFMGMPLSRVEEYILTYSNNDWAHNVRRWLHDGAGDQVWRKAAMAYADLDESYYSTDYADYCYYTARYITKVLETLYYGGEERFPNVIPCMLNGNPVNYFKLSDQMRQYEIAQKYGSFIDQNNRNWNATVGIIYTEHPIIVSVLTLDAPNSEKVLSDSAILFTEYTREVDGRLDSYREAQAEAERQRQEEEKAAEEQRQAEQQAALEQQAEAEHREEVEAKQKNLRRVAVIVGVAGGALALVLIAGAALSARRSKRKRYENYRRRFEEEMRQEQRERQTAARRRGEMPADAPRARRPAEQTRRPPEQTRRPAEQTRRPAEQTRRPSEQTRRPAEARRPRVTEVQRPRRPRGNVPEDPDE